MKMLIVALLLVIAVLLPAATGTWGLTESSEARYAEISREMYTSGDYVSPRLLGIHHYHKPPFTYYLTCLGYYIFGINEYGTRFFLHIALLLQLLLVYKIAQLLYSNVQVSLTATLIYFSYPIVQIAAKNLTTDAYLTTLIFGSIYFLLKYKQQGNTLKYLYLFYIFCGLAFLTKGPVGILPQAVFAILYSKTFKIKRVFNIHSFLSLFAGLVIAVSWFILLLYTNDKLLHYFLKYQLVDRVASNAFDRSKPFWYYFLFLPLTGLPAIIYFAAYLRSNIRSLNLRTGTSGVLLLTFSVLLLVFSASSSKLILYVLPLYLFCALISAKYLAEIDRKKIAIFENVALIFSGALFLCMITACFIPLPLSFPKMAILLLSVSGIAILLVVKKITFKVPFLKVALINALGMGVLIFIASIIMKANELAINSVKPVAAFIKEQSKDHPPGTIVVYNYLLPSLAFYTGEKIITVNNGNTITERETQFETGENSWRNTYVKLAQNKGNHLLPALLSKSNSYIIAQRKDPLPDSLAYLRKDLPHEKLMGKWIIYF